MNWTYRDVTVLSLISALATTPAFSQALAQPSNPVGAIRDAGQAVGDKTVEVLEAAGQELAPPAYSSPGSVIAATGQPASPYPVPPPSWYFDRPAVPLSPYAGQPYYAVQPGEPRYAGQPYAYAAQPAAQAYATRPLGDKN